MTLITSNPTRTAERTIALRTYFQNAVFHDDNFTCPNAAACLASRSPNGLRRGQLHHVGRDYDLMVDGRPLRIAVVGQEYGGGHEFTTLEKRSLEIQESRERGFKASRGVRARNPHMKGTTSVLRLLLGLGLGRDQGGEFVSLADGNRSHVFDCFALTNYLLCSAVNAESRTRGLSTSEMRENCRTHFRRTMDLLEPTVLVLQSKWFLSDVLAAFDEHERIADHLFSVGRGDKGAMLLAFTHPASRGRASNWGWNERTPYLEGTVAPTVEKWRSLTQQVTWSSESANEKC